MGSEFATRSAALDEGGANTARVERLYELALVLIEAEGEERTEYEQFSSPVSWALLRDYARTVGQRFLRSTRLVGAEPGGQWAAGLLEQAHRQGLWLWIAEAHLTMPELLGRPLVLAERDSQQLQQEWDNTALELKAGISITAFSVINKLMERLMASVQGHAELQQPKLTSALADELFGGLARGYLLGVTERRYRRGVAVE
jgi:hypothetical protein